MTQKVIEYKPNPGPQTQFLESPARVIIYGGLPGGGKSHGLLLEGVGNYQNPLFVGLILRRVRENLKKVGGIWPASKILYSPLGSKVNNSELTHTFPSGCTIGFGGMQNAESDHEKYKSVEADFIGFEELTEFEEHQFFYMFSRNRGKSGVEPYIRATTNPKYGWVFRFLKSGGYVSEDGFAIPEMSGVIRWFYRDEDTEEYLWFDTEQEAWDDINGKNLDDVAPVSFTFILASAKDNPYQRDDYVASLSNLTRVERERLKRGNWKIEDEEGDLFKSGWWRKTLTPPPIDRFKKFVRSWDLAHTEKPPKNSTGKKKRQPARTAGVLMGVTHDNHFYIFDVDKFQHSPAKVRSSIKRNAEQDRQQFGRVEITLPLDPGAGKAYYDQLKEELVGHIVKPMPTIGNKMTRAEGFSNAVENGLVHLVVGDWNDAFTNEGSTFPFGTFKDQIDAAADAYDYLTGRRKAFSKNWENFKSNFL